MPQRHRLRTGADFHDVTRGHCRARAGSRLLVVHASVTDSRAIRAPRVGFVVPGSVGNAVIRNRVKRRLRALAASRIERVPDGVDLVIRAQAPSAAATWEVLGGELDRLLGRALQTLTSQTSWSADTGSVDPR